jgi:hypothetical protein
MRSSCAWYTHYPASAEASIVATVTSLVHFAIVRRTLFDARLRSAGGPSRTIEPSIHH